jgi:hypothetical protein
MVEMEDLEKDIWVNWQEVNEIVSGPSVVKFEEWRVRLERTVFTKREGREGRYALYQEFDNEI